MKPIGYVVLFRAHKSMEWEPMALSACAQSDPPQGPQLLIRSCLTMFPTEDEAMRQLKRMEGHPAMHKAECRIVAVFSDTGPAPTAKEKA